MYISSFLFLSVLSLSPQYGQLWIFVIIFAFFFLFLFCTHAILIYLLAWVTFSISIWTCARTFSCTASVSCSSFGHSSLSGVLSCLSLSVQCALCLSVVFIYIFLSPNLGRCWSIKPADTFAHWRTECPSLCFWLWYCMCANAMQGTSTGTLVGQ